MGFLRIRCDYCGGNWEVYQHLKKDEKARQCPHCFKEIDSQTWENQICPSWGAMEDSNLELVKDTTGYGNTLFEVSYIGDIIFKNARNRRRR